MKKHFPRPLYFSIHIEFYILTYLPIVSKHYACILMAFCFMARAFGIQKLIFVDHGHQKNKPNLSILRLKPLPILAKSSTFQLLILNWLDVFESVNINYFFFEVYNSIILFLQNWVILISKYFTQNRNFSHFIQINYNKA